MVNLDKLASINGFIAQSISCNAQDASIAARMHYRLLLCNCSNFLRDAAASERTRGARYGHFRKVHSQVSLKYLVGVEKFRGHRSLLGQHRIKIGLGASNGIQISIIHCMRRPGRKLRVDLTSTAML